MGEPERDCLPMTLSEPSELDCLNIGTWNMAIAVGMIQDSDDLCDAKVVTVLLAWLCEATRLGYPHIVPASRDNALSHVDIWNWFRSY